MSSIAGKLTNFTRKEVETLFAQAHAIERNPSFTLLGAPQTKEFGRILIIASRHVGTAPQRNKLKRRIKAIFYEEKLFERGYDCIIILKKEAVNLSFEKLKQMLLNSFEKIR